MKLIIKLKELLEKKNMTEKELSEKTGVNLEVITKLAENQLGIVNINDLNKIVNELDINDMRELMILIREKTN